MAHLLDQSIPKDRSGSPVTCSTRKLPEKWIWLSCQGTVQMGSLIFSVDGNWYFNFLPKLMHAMPVLPLSFLSFLISDHQKMLVSACIFARVGYPKCNISITCFSRSPGTINLPPAINKQKRSVGSLKTVEFLLRAHLVVLQRYSQL